MKKNLLCTCFSRNNLINYRSLGCALTTFCITEFFSIWERLYGSVSFHRYHLQALAIEMLKVVKRHSSETINEIFDVLESKWLVWTNRGSKTVPQQTYHWVHVLWQNPRLNSPWPDSFIKDKYPIELISYCLLLLGYQICPRYDIFNRIVKKSNFFLSVFFFFFFYASEVVSTLRRYSWTI